MSQPLGGTSLIWQISGYSMEVLQEFYADVNDHIRAEHVDIYQRYI